MDTTGRVQRLLPLLLVAVATSGCGCDLSNCVSSEVATFELPINGVELAESTLSACRNEDCRTAPLASLEGAEDSPYAQLLPIDAAPRAEPDVRLSVFATIETDRIDFKLAWTIPSAVAVAADDMLGAQITTTSGQELFAAQAPIGTISTRSNDCGDRTCRSASVDLSAL